MAHAQNYRYPGCGILSTWPAPRTSSASRKRRDSCARSSRISAEGVSKPRPGAGSKRSCCGLWR
jgi:hypothetical protein